MYDVEAVFLYSGLSDYWSGDGERWEDNKGCLFSFYTHETTLEELVEGWIDDLLSGSDCDSLPPEITDDHIREAIMDMLTEEGKAELEKGEEAGPCEIAQSFGLCNSIDDMTQEEIDEMYEMGDLPVAIILIRVEKETEGV